MAFDTPAQSQRSKVLDANGDVLTYFYEENRVYVELDKIAPVMQQAMIAIEDHRFYEHGPLDLTGTLRALINNLATGEETQGGSTITQQYVKMVQIEEAKKRGDDAGIQAAQDRATAGRSASCATPSRSRRPCPRTRSSSGTSTSPTSATARTASRWPPSTTSAPPPPS